MGYKSRMRWSDSVSMVFQYRVSASGRSFSLMGSPISLARSGEQRLKLASAQPVHQTMASVWTVVPVSRVTAPPLAEVRCARLTCISFSSSTSSSVLRSLSCVMVPPGTNQNMLG